MTRAHDTTHDPMTGRALIRPTRPTRVLHVVDHWLPRPDGYASRSLGIVAGQRDSGAFEPAVLVTSRQHIGASAPAVGIDGVRVLAADEGWFEGLVRRSRPHHVDRGRLQAAIVRAARETEADVVHVHWSSVVGASAVMAAAELGVPCVAEVRFDLAGATVSSSSRLDGRPVLERALRAWFERHLQRADAIVAASWSLAEAVSRATGRVAHPVPNGVDADRFHPVDDDRDGPLRVGAVSNLLAYEGFGRLVPLVADVRGRGVDVEGHLVGGGAVLPDIRAAAERNGVPFTCTGRVPRDRAPDMWRELDIACLPRHRSTITQHASPLKLVEAMATGLPTVASAVGDVPHLLAGGRGVAVPADDDAALADAVVELGRDAEARRVMGKLAREHVVQRYSWARSVARYREVYRDALAA